MKKTILTAVMVCFTAGMALALPPEASVHSPGAENGYLTVGNNVVVLPVPLRTGDRIELYNLQGTRILNKTVGDGFLSFNMRNFPEGLYNLVVERGRNMIATAKVPVAARR